MVGQSFSSLVVVNLIRDYSVKQDEQFRRSRATIEVAAAVGAYHCYRAIDSATGGESASMSGDCCWHDTYPWITTRTGSNIVVSGNPRGGLLD